MTEQRTEPVAGGATRLHVFEKQVDEAPESVAIRFPSGGSGADTCLTYGELDRRANQVAHWLKAREVGPEVLVGVLMERSLDLAVAILGILKAGGAYVALDPVHPQERLAFMLEDTRTPVILTQAPHVKRLLGCRAEVLSLDEDWAVIARESATRPAIEVTSQNLFAAFYTSGSTGWPKAVMKPHGQVADPAEKVVTRPFTAKDRHIWKSSLGVGALNAELFRPLMSGGQLVVVPAGGELDPSYLVEVIAEHRVVIIETVPSMLLLLLDERVIENCDSLEYIICSGETLPDSTQRRLFSLLDVTLIEYYGTTESPGATLCVNRRENAEKVTSIGRPAPGRLVYIVDECLQPVPSGATGELYLGCELARGYLNRPALTAERFIPDPFCGTPGAHMYKSGDIGRYRPDGTIEYLGRSDDQVQLRGYRVEPGEIQTVLAQHPDVRAVAVLAREAANESDQKRLIAYVIPKQQSGLATRELRRFLQQRLPPHMLPATFVMLDSFPLLPGGKLDRSALPVPDETGRDLRTASGLSRTPVEAVLASICAQILGIDRVGIDDDFFEMGGHSLLATQVMSRVRTTFQADLPVRSLFESPTVAGLARRIESVRRAIPAVEAAPLVSVPRVGNLPLSFAQERLWFLDQLEPGNAAYNIAQAYNLSGPLNVAALEQSLNEIVRRHETLRTTFETIDGRPVQIIAPALTTRVTRVDLRAWPEDERQEEARRLAADAAQQPFDLRIGPLLRATLFQTGLEQYILLVVQHHVVSDGWSLGVFFRELAALYGAFCAARPSPLPELPIQYADFAVWQREWLQGEVLAAQLAYWRERLEGASELQLPTDRPRPALQTFEGARLALSFSQELSAAIRALSRREGVTVFMTLLAAFQVLLYRYNGQEDMVVGTPIANRDRAEIEGLIGFFVNTLALRTDFSPTAGGMPTFCELLAQVRELCLGAYANQHLPFEKLVEELQPQRDVSRNPLFQVSFAGQNAPRGAIEMKGLTVTPWVLDDRKVRLDLECHVWDDGESIRGSLIYKTALFDAAPMTRLVGHYRTLLEAVVADPGRRVSELPLLTDAERRQVLVEWNQTQTEYPKDSSIHRLFEAQVERTPDAVAVVSADKELTYSELNHKANQLARYLQKLGVGPEVLVGLCVDRSLDMVVGQLGILKAGGAYVPLDPTYPRERLAFMLADTRTLLLLTQQALMDLLPGSAARLVCLDSDWATVTQESQANLPYGGWPEQPAYVMYTSGSTGTPKGIVIPHRAISRLVLGTNYVELGPGDRVAQASNGSFDAVTFEVWGALLTGAQLVMFPKDVVLSPQQFCAELRHQRITTLFLTTALFNLLAREVPGAFQSLRDLLFGGETVDPRWVRQVLENDPPKRLLHVYGPTESTTFASWHRVREVAEGAASVPIGRPISNTQIYLLDANLEPVPMGLAGELYLGGAGLARGYLNQPALTAERFIPNPFAAEPGSRLYRTGDLARYSSDGAVEFLGRVDFQVKIHGFRIEPAEIEAVLEQHPGVRQSIVSASDDTPDDYPAAPGTDRRLVAYVVPKEMPGLTVCELRSFLKERLPEYMLPSAVVFLHALPLSPSGKLDRAALPAPDQLHPELEKAFVAPRTPVEVKLADIWTRLLRLDEVGIHDDFFALGGHSLLAMRLFAEIERVFGIQIPVAALFQAPTVEQLAQAIGQAGPKSEWCSAVPLQPNGSKPPLFFVHNFGGGLFIYRELVPLLGPDQPVYGLLPKGQIGAEPPDTRMDDLAAHCIRAMRTVQRSGPFYLGGYCFSGSVAFEMACQLEDQGERVALLAVIDGSAPAPVRVRVWHYRYVFSFLRNLPDWLWDNVPGRYGVVASRIWTRLRGKVRTTWRTLRGRKARADARDLLEDFLGDMSHVPERFHQLMVAHVLAGRGYRPRVYHGQLTLFRARALPLTYADDPEQGWGRLATGGVEVKIVSGNHTNLLQKPHVESLATEVKASLAQAQSATQNILPEVANGS